MVENNEKTIKDYSAKLNRDAKIPLYKQLYLELKKEIESSQRQTKDFFYSEKELIEKYEVSRITVRSALQLLEDEGYISRSQGSTSVVVNQNKYSWNLKDVMHDLSQFKHLLETDVVSCEKVEPSQKVRKKLNLKNDMPYVYRIERIRKVKEKKLARSISYLPLSIDVRLDDLNEENNFSITELLREKGENPYYAEETIEAVNGDEETCRVLNLPENSAVFLRKKTTYDHMDKPLEFVVSYYNSQHTKYYVKDKLL